MLERRLVTRYVAPLREGGSLPGLVEADDLGTYVAKFADAGQGRRALVAEVIVARLARELGLRVPDLVILDLDPGIATYEADEEVQALLGASTGDNLGADFLPGSFGWDSAGRQAEAAEAARVLWLDALTANIDRTWKNPNLLRWHGRLWCIDHGSALYFHHSWPAGVGDPARFAGQGFDPSTHVFASVAPVARSLDPELAPVLSEEVLVAACAEVPDSFLDPVPGARALTRRGPGTWSSCGHGWPSGRPGCRWPVRRECRFRPGWRRPDGLPVRAAPMRPGDRPGRGGERRGGGVRAVRRVPRRGTARGRRPARLPTRRSGPLGRGHRIGPSGGTVRRDA